ncbi:MAG TPA: hypothetical protein VFR42_08415, partial [Candidatus Acidoferrum sp.]|nr:hypothetical protein [Candidatus Acidoferrum sp.]
GAVVFGCFTLRLRLYGGTGCQKRGSTAKATRQGPTQSKSSGTSASKYEGFGFFWLRNLLAWAPNLFDGRLVRALESLGLSG